MLAEAVVDILAAEGYEVIQASDGMEALGLLDQTDPDLILLDINMPLLDGTATLREIRSRPAHAHKPVILMSARPQAFPASVDATRHQARLQKPFTPEQLLETVATNLHVATNRQPKA